MQETAHLENSSVQIMQKTAHLENSSVQIMQKTTPFCLLKQNGAVSAYSLLNFL